MYFRVAGSLLALSLALLAQEPAASTSAGAPTAQVEQAENGLKTERGKEEATHPDEFVIATGTKIPLSMINSVSTKSAAEGDRIYLETVFPIISNGRIVIPPGSYVAGTVTQVKRPGRVKGRGELYIRFDSLTLPNGVTRDFRSRIGSLDGRASESLDKEEGKIKGEGNKSGDLMTIGQAAGVGAGVGGLGGAAAGRAGMGAGIGGAAGATAGLIGVLLSRGPDAVLARGTTMDMVLDRSLAYNLSELDFSNALPRAQTSDGSGPLPSRKTQTINTRRWPF
jgi:type IV secretion system protein VirB10